MLAQALVFPHFDYCSSNISLYHINKLYILQNRLPRFLLSADIRTLVQNWWRTWIGISLLVDGNSNCLTSRGGGALPLAGMRHAPVNRPPFLHRLYTECPLFSQLYTQWPLFLLFRSQIFSDIIKFWKILQIATKISLKIVKIAQIFIHSAYTTRML